MKLIALITFLILSGLKGIGQSPNDTTLYPLKISWKLSAKQINKPYKDVYIIFRNTSDTLFKFKIHLSPLLKAQTKILFSHEVEFSHNLIGCDGSSACSVNITLLPKKSFIYTGVISYPDSLKGKQIPLKAGIRFIKKSTPEFDMSDLKDEKLWERLELWEKGIKYDYIWSKPILIKFD
jgi:hypothetical protein